MPAAADGPRGGTRQGVADLKAEDEPSPDAPASGPDDAVRHRIEELARAWDHRAEDVSRLLDRAAGSLAEDANHELRQIFTMMHTQLELAAHRSTGGHAQLDEETLDEVLAAIERGTHVVERYLDRREIAKSLIQLQLEPLDLRTLLDRLFELEPLDPEDDRVRVVADPVRVRADREKLYRVVSFLVTALWRTAPEQGRLTVRIEEAGAQARCFIGIDPCPLEREELMERLVARLTIDDLQIDVPYARAIIERHGGVVFVDDREPGFLGYGFELPVLEGSA